MNCKDIVNKALVAIDESGLVPKCDADLYDGWNEWQCGNKEALDGAEKTSAQIKEIDDG